jgi:hypothetical protein
VANKERKLGAVTFTWSGDQYTKAVEAGVWDGLQRAGLVLQLKMKETLGRPGKSSPGEPPRLKTGSLRDSIQSVPDPAGRVVRVGTNDFRGRMFEFGKTIRPVRAKMLAIPLNKKSAERYQQIVGTGFVSVAGTLRQLPNKMFVVRKGGKLLLLESDGKGGVRKNGYAYLLLWKSVILPRPWVHRSYVAAKPLMQTAFENAISRAINGARTK